MIPSNDMIDPDALEREWLNNYVVTGSHTAFASLVDRHVDLVYSAALRQTHGDKHMAEDVTQAAFLVLATRAARLRREVSIASWLVVVTRHAARDALKSEARRKRREQAVAISATAVTLNPTIDQMMSLPYDSIANHPDVAEWQAIAPELDAALASLRDKDRRAVVLRYLQGRSIEEVAAITGATPNAAKQRLHRAVDRMRAFFRTRGITNVSTAMLGPILLRHAVHAAPPGLAKGIAAVGFSAAGASASGVAIAKGVVVAMAWTKAKVAVVAGASFLLLAGGTAVVVKAIHRPPAEQMMVLNSNPVGLNPPGVVVAIGPPVQDDWLVKFNDTYRLEPGQAMKFIPRPFPPERAMYLQKFHLPEKALLAFRWDGSPHLFSTTVGTESFFNPAQFGTNFEPYLYEDPANLLRTPISGDWIFRKDADRQEVLTTIAGMLSVKLGSEVRFEKQSVLREVLVVTGRFDPDRVRSLPAGEFAIGFRRTPQTGPPNRGSLQAMLNSISFSLQFRVIDESTGSQETVPIVPWRHYGTDAKDADQILKEFSEQTGLQFRREMRKVDVWMLIQSADKGDWRTRFNAVYNLLPGENMKFIPRPFMPERAQYITTTDGLNKLDFTDENSVARDACIGFTWKDGKPSWQTAGGLNNFKELMYASTRLLWYEYDDAAQLLKPKLPGDWIYRADAKREDILASIAERLSMETGTRLRYEKRPVTRDVLVITGQVDQKRLAALPSGELKLGIQDASQTVSGGPYEKRHLKNVFECLTYAAQMKFIDRTKGSDTEVNFRQFKITPENLKLVLTDLANQTGLKFDLESQTYDVWQLIGPDGKQYQTPLRSTKTD